MTSTCAIHGCNNPLRSSQVQVRADDESDTIIRYCSDHGMIVSVLSWCRWSDLEPRHTGPSNRVINVPDIACYGLLCSRSVTTLGVCMVALDSSLEVESCASIPTLEAAAYYYIHQATEVTQEMGSTVATRLFHYNHVDEPCSMEIQDVVDTGTYRPVLVHAIQGDIQMTRSTRACMLMTYSPSRHATSDRFEDMVPFCTVDSSCTPVHIRSIRWTTTSYEVRFDHIISLSSTPGSKVVHTCRCPIQSGTEIYSADVTIDLLMKEMSKYGYLVDTAARISDYPGARHVLTLLMEM